MITPPRDAPGPLSSGRRALALGIGSALGAVIVAPIALSSQDLVKWGEDPRGLGLDPFWAWLVFIALDLAAAVCVGMVTYSAWRGESGGIFHVLTWMFAGASAYANYRHGTKTPAADDQLFFPAMSLMGPLLLEVTLHRIRRWTRAAERTAMAARPHFGARWLPGVALAETLQAWAAAKREDIRRPEDAIAYVRERRSLAELGDVDAIRYAWSALGTRDEYEARVWLQARGRTVAQAAVDAAAGRTATPPVSVVMLPPTAFTLHPTSDPEPDPEPEPVTVPLAELSQADAIRHAIDAAASHDPGVIVAWLANHGVTVARQRVCDVMRRDGTSSRHRLASVPSQPSSRRATG